MQNNDFINGKIGFMQGRLSPSIDGLIQAFPWPYWRNEFELAAHNDFYLMEWTIDQTRLHENPLMTAAGRKEINGLMGKYGVSIQSLTGDCFMQAPFYKTSGPRRKQLLADLASIILSSAEIGINTILMPLVDQGRIENKEQENTLLEGLSGIIPVLQKTGIVISFESDFPPESLSRFITHLNPSYFGITYDIGNSAALGYNPAEEINVYGHRIINVHIKDSELGGATVPLGRGNADIRLVFSLLREIGYTGNYILQTARAVEEDHVSILCKYRDMVANWLSGLEE